MATLTSHVRFNTANAPKKNPSITSYFFHHMFGSRAACERSLLVANIGLLLLGATLLIVNLVVLSLDMADALRKWAFSGMFVDGGIILSQAIFGLVMLCVANMRKNDIILSTTALPLSYLVIELFGLIVNSLFTLANMILAIKLEITREFSDETQFVLELNYAVGFSIFLASVLAHVSYHYLLNPWLASHYTASEVDLSTLDEETLKTWGNLINTSYGTKFIGAWDGHSALSLMKTYQEAMSGGKDSPIPYVKGVVLRFDYKGAGSTLPVVPVDESVQVDRQHSRPSDLETKRLQPREESGDMKGPSLQDAKLTSMEEGRVTSVEDMPSAIVFLTVVERFDLGRYVSGCCGRLLSWILGAESCMPMLCLRWGLVGFQWPFHGGFFMMRQSRTPMEDMSQVQRSLVQWNRCQSQPCTVLMAPAYVTQLDSWAFENSHFLNLEVGPSVIVDLRRYKGLDYKSFQRLALKKGNRRNHAGYFSKKGGTFVVSRDFSEFDEKYDKLHAYLTSATAAARVGRGEVPLLCPVTPGVVRKLSETHGKEFRRQFGIRVNGKAAGAAILFEFPKTKLVTSDMQGLQHDIARPTRAYFAMLALTVELCLKEGVDFLDFGPTTLDPKLDVGGRLIPTRAGYYTHSMILRTFIKSGLKRFRKLNRDVEERLQNQEKKTSFWAYNQPYVEKDFQHLTEEIKNLYKPLPKLIPVKDLQNGNKPSKGKKHKNRGKQGKKASEVKLEKKTKKQLNKEKAKARRKALKAAKKKAEEKEIKNSKASEKDVKKSLKKGKDIKNVRKNLKKDEKDIKPDEKEKEKDIREIKIDKSDSREEKINENVAKAEK